MTDNKTSNGTILGRFGIYGASFGVSMFWIATALGVSVTIGPFIIGGLLGIGLLVGFVWLVVRIVGAIFLGNDPDYQAWRSNGGDPYLDNLPAPWNTDPFCPHCSARVQSLNEPCWNCGHGNGQVLEQVICPGCHKTIHELTPGDLRSSGIICCYCGCHVIIDEGNDDINFPTMEV